MLAVVQHLVLDAECQSLFVTNFSTGAYICKVGLKILIMIIFLLQREIYYVLWITRVVYWNSL